MFRVFLCFSLVFCVVLSAEKHACPTIIKGSVHYPDGTQASKLFHWFGLQSRIRVVHGDGEVIEYNRTNRLTEKLRDELLYPADLASPAALKGLSVLDIGCGGGGMVEELRARDVDAYGSDIFLTASQRRNPYLVLAQAARLPFESDRFDVVYSTWSFLAYEGRKDDPAGKQAVVDFLRGAARVTKAGGSLRFSPVHLGELQEALRSVPELRLARSADAAWLRRFYYAPTLSSRDIGPRLSASTWVELRKEN